jgi:hypothetical protein
VLLSLLAIGCVRFGYDSVNESSTIGGRSGLLGGQAGRSGAGVGGATAAGGNVATSSMGGASGTQSGGNSTRPGGAGGVLAGTTGGTTSTGTGGVTFSSGGIGPGIGGTVPSAGGTTSASGGSGSGGTSTKGTGGLNSSMGGTGGACDWSSGPPAFGAALSIGMPNTTAPEIDPVLSHDGLSLYFVSYRDDKQVNDIYVSTRSSMSASFGAGVVLSSANSTSNDTHFFVSPTNLEAFVSSDRSGTTGGMDIFSATRPSTSANWKTFTPVANINTANDEFDPHLEADQLTLWFDPIGRPDGSGLQDLFFVVRPDPLSPFGSPVAATSLNTAANEWNVSLTDDGKVIVFQSDRNSAQHVYYATRTARGAAFGAPAIITALDPYIATLTDPFVAPDGCSIYFAATLTGGAGGQDIYQVVAP